MKVAIEGCAHGELDKIYETIEYIQTTDNVKIDLLICCGDFQSTRNVQDLRCMAVPLKYQNMCSFYKYYSGEKVAPVLTLFIGGNHEASNYLQELPYGGWVAPNIYYMGYAGVVNIAGVRIGGLSGIYKGHDYMKGHFEKPPYTEETKRSCYHIRNLEVFRLKQLKESVDIFLSHDWPRGVYHHGNIKQLLRIKPFLEDDINKDSLGSKPCEELLHQLKPKYWFAAHLHVKFAAVVEHSTDSKECSEKSTTRFLALDKCLPKRRFLQVMDIPHDLEKPMELEYDLEWLAVLHLTNHLLSVQKSIVYMPGPGHESRWNFTPTADELEFIKLKFGSNLTIPNNFSQTVQPYNSADNYNSPNMRQPSAQLNPQTMVFCDQLGVDDPMALLLNCSSEPGSLNSSEISSCSLPSFLTPKHSKDNTLVSFDEEDFNSSPGLESQIKNKCVTQSPRQSLLLPSPKRCNEEDSEKFEPTAADDNVETKSSSSFDDSHNISSSTDETSDSQNALGSEEKVPDVSVDTRPKQKKFKRRNESLYVNTEEDD